MRQVAALAVAGGLSSLCHGASAAGFDGWQVTATGYCCTGPVEGDRFTIPLTRTVGAGLEFASGSIETTTRRLIESNIDVGTSTIDIGYTQTAIAAGGLFNGYAFDFAGAGLPRIVGASLDPLSTYPAASIGLSFDRDSVFYNAAGLHITAGSRVLIDVSFASAVPEPPAWLLTAAGLMWLATLGQGGVPATRSRLPSCWRV
jgi:hypothetical protein